VPSAAIAGPFTAHGVVVAVSSTNSQVTSTAAGTSGQCLISNGASANPTYQNCPNTGTVNSGTAGQVGYYASNGTAVSGALLKGAYIWAVPSNITVANGSTTIEPNFAHVSGTITSVDYETKGTTPSFTASVTIGGTNVTGCNGLTVSSATNTNVACTGANTLSSGSVIAIAISGVSGTPNQAVVKVNLTYTVN